MLLSIGMIVKNEETYLERCLTALAPVLEQLDSELIIGDTGSEDDTCEIARKYTDHVFSIPWKGDYAAARNEVLKKATGDWFMSLDADEIFTDTSELIDFFRSGEYRDYNAATYVVRSFNDYAETVYSDFNAGRLVRVREDTAYRGRIHEQLFPYLEPIRYLGSIVNHYGYITEDSNREAALEKSLRNVRLLEKELKRRPADPLLHSQLGDSLRMGGNRVEALTSYDNAIRFSRIRTESDVHILHGAYKNKAGLLTDMEEWQGVVDTADKYFNTVKKAHDCTDIDIQSWKADALYRLGRYGEAAEALKTYLEDYHALQGGDYDGAKLMLKVIGTHTEHIRKRSEIRLAECLIKSGDPIEAQSVLGTIWEWAKNTPEDTEEYTRLALAYMDKSGDCSWIPAICPGLGRECMAAFRIQVEYYLREQEKTEGREAALLEALSRIRPQDAWCMVKGLDFRLRFRSQVPAREEVEAVIREAKKAREKHGELLYYGILAGVGATELAGYIPPEDVKEYYSYCCRKYQDMPEVVCRGMETYSGETDPYANLWLAFLYGSELASCPHPLEETKLLFSHYTVHFYQYLAKVYREEIFMEDNIRLLPREHQAGCYCCLAQLCHEDGLQAGYVKYLRLALEAERGLKDAVQTLPGGVSGASGDGAAEGVMAEDGTTENGTDNHLTI